MDAVVKTKWLDALRSGEYEQATGVLTALDSEGKVAGHCCLGVLSDLAVREGVIPPGKPANVHDSTDPENFTESSPADRLVYGEEDNPKWPRTFTMTSATELPAAVREWSGLGDPTPDVLFPRADEDIEADRQEGIPNPDTSYVQSLAELNDEHRLSFAEIADLIEEQA